MLSFPVPGKSALQQLSAIPRQCRRQAWDGRIFARKLWARGPNLPSLAKAFFQGAYPRGSLRRRQKFFRLLQKKRAACCQNFSISIRYGHLGQFPESHAQLQAIPGALRQPPEPACAVKNRRRSSPSCNKRLIPASPQGPSSFKPRRAISGRACIRAGIPFRNQAPGRSEPAKFFPEYRPARRWRSGYLASRWE